MSYLYAFSGDARVDFAELEPERQEDVLDVLEELVEEEPSPYDEDILAIDRDVRDGNGRIVGTVSLRAAWNHETQRLTVIGLRLT